MHILEQIHKVFSQKIAIGANVQVTGYTIVLRLIALAVTASWIAFFPSYLLLVHMKVERFYSYDVFTTGVLGVSAFLMLVALLIAVSSFYLWGFVIIFRRAAIDKAKSLWIAGFIFVLVSIFFHILIFDAGIESDQLLRTAWISVLGAVFSFAVAGFMTDPVRSLVTNWYAPLLSIAVSAAVPIIFPNVTSDVVRTGLVNFGVGGGVPVTVYQADTGRAIKTGKLLLLTPDYTYIRDSEDSYVSISRSNQTYVSVGAKEDRKEAE